MQGLNLIQGKSISIHALREEGDTAAPTQQYVPIISIHALREEGDTSSIRCRERNKEFLSTPSARRATFSKPAATAKKGISIHALREEGD